MRVPRSVSAYDNALINCDDERPTTIPTSSSFSEDVPEVEKSQILEVNIGREVSEPNGMAFRMVGSRSRGIFIAYVHPSSMQASLLRNGDRILKCNGISIRAVSVDQAASILRYWMNHRNSLQLLIERRENGESVMIRRRRQERISMCLDKKEQERHWNLNIEPSRAMLKMTSSKSAEILRNDFEDTPHYTNRYTLFDTTEKSAVCPQCNTPTKVLYLHQFSHGLINNAFRLLTLSKSSYSLL
ncbi:unnamed protein product [Caenorhabditis bovis]|uniref:PDZ domain-containing protein n=1 Tax=Caenorhabditis bovis TaxID=2654633 RepID=A0A8S1F9A1_9PELO|nr:unnamed protein product [Caenorhabditis bovis]